MLEEQCKSWMGITSVAVYWPLIYFQSNNTENLEGAKVTVEAFHVKMEQQGEMAALPRLIGWPNPISNVHIPSSYASCLP